MVMMNLTRNDGTEPATFVTALRAPVEMAVTIEATTVSYTCGSA